MAQLRTAFDQQQLTENYFARNKRWLMPLVAGFIVVTSPAVVGVLTEQPPLLPSAVTAGAGILAAFAVGLGAIRTDTLSAYVLVRVMVVAGLVVTGAMVFKQLF